MKKNLIYIMEERTKNIYGLEEAGWVLKKRSGVDSFVGGPMEYWIYFMGPIDSFYDEGGRTMVKRESDKIIKIVVDSRSVAIGRSSGRGIIFRKLRNPLEESWIPDAVKIWIIQNIDILSRIP
jgi:hypothetical protein